MRNPLAYLRERFTITRSSLPHLEGDDDSGTPSFRSAYNVNQYWRHYKTNPIVRAAVVEGVHAMTTIPFIAEYYSVPTQAWLPLPPTDRLVRRLRRPSRSFPPAVFWARQFTEQAVTGNQFIWKRRGGPEVIDEFRRIDSRYAFPYAAGDEELAGYRYNASRLVADSVGAPSH